MKRAWIQGTVLATGLLALGACSYNAPVDISPAYNVYSNYDNKLPGRYAVYVDTRKLSKTNKVKGYACSAHDFPMDAEKPFKASVFKTLKNLVEHVEPVNKPLNRADLQAQKLDGLIHVMAEDMDIELDVLASEIEAEAEIIANVRVDGRRGRLLGTTISAEDDARAPSGMFCAGGAEAISLATENTLKRLMQVMGEKISNSERIRKGR